MGGAAGPAGSGAWAGLAAWGLWAPVLVFTGAGAGAVLRWALGLWLNAMPPGLPWGTLAANVLGGFLVGCAMAGLSDSATGVDPQTLRSLKLLLVTGFLGGLTTFSTFSAEVVTLLQDGRWLPAAGWALLHLLGSLAMTALGIGAARLAFKLTLG